MSNIKNNKKIIILAIIATLFIVFLGALIYSIIQKNSKIKTPEPSSSSSSSLSREEKILRSLAPLTAPELSAEELAKEKTILKQLNGKTKKLFPSNVEKEKELLKSLSAPNKYK